MDTPSGPTRDWYKKSFGELYLLLYAHRDDEAARGEIVALLGLLGLGKDSRVLDLCCGPGRHLEALLEAGVDAVGLDLSPELLRVAARKPPLASRLVRGDVRALPFCASFTCVVNLFSSFGYFVEDRENEATLAEMARVLLPAGTLVIDHMNEPWIRRTLVPRTEECLQGGTLVQVRRINGERVEKEITWNATDGSTHRFHESVRIYRVDELAGLLRRSGLSVTNVWGTFSGDPLTERSRRMILKARKEGSGTCGSA